MSTTNTSSTLPSNFSQDYTTLLSEIVMGQNIETPNTRKGINQVQTASIQPNKGHLNL